MNLDTINILVLAYMGDAIYEKYVREYLINSGINKVKELQETAIKYVSANSQARILKELIDNNLLSEEELSVVYRARNHNSNHKPKSTDIITYKHATGLEALIGYLYFKNEEIRIENIMKEVLK